MDALAERVAVVTAATRGIGLACAWILARHGAITYVAARSEKEGSEAVAAMSRAGCTAHFIAFDARERQSYEYVIKSVGQREGRLDILVNNFGTTDAKKDGDLLGGDMDVFFATVQTNIQSVYLGCRYAIPYMMPTGGSIINISSIAAVVPDLSRLGYTVSKAAIDALTRNIALQYARYNIRCNAVLPGLIGTDAALRSMSPAFIESFRRHVPLGRLGTPEDVAAAVYYYASDASSYVTGMIHEVAGGYALGTPQYGEYAHDPRLSR